MTSEPTTPSERVEEISGGTIFVGARESRPRILIVENETNHALYLHTVLSSHRDPVTGQKYEIDFATSIASAKHHLESNLIDIYLVDLIMIANEGDPKSSEDSSIGKNFINDIVQSSNAGVIVYSSIPPERESKDLLELGADDYIWKYPHVDNESIPGILRARVAALWRRIQLSRPSSSQLFTHANRVFLVGPWRFAVGDRALTKQDGDAVQLSASEHALLRFACVTDSNEVDADAFAAQALHKDSTSPFRLDNLVHRLKKKLGNDVEWRSLGNRNYKLISVCELKPGTQ